MSLRPEIFVSAVVPELNAFRKVAKQTLIEIGARPLEQTDYSIEYGPLHGIISQLLNRCEAMIHLAGFDYGMEPAERTLHAPRRSFAQYEVDVARLIGKTMYVFMATEACQAEPHKWEEEEKRFLQTQHRVFLERSGATVIPFSTAEELAQQIRKLRPQLIVRHSLARLPAKPMGARFIGRNRLMEELGDQLASGRIDVIHPLPGGPLKGQGKTCLAIEVGWRLHDERRFDFVFWIPAGPRAEMEVSLAALARTDSLALLPDEVVSHRIRYEAVLEWFAQEKNSGRWLMIVDGVDDEVAWWSLRTILPHLGKGAVLLTGCRPAWPGSQGHALTSFSVERGRDFLANRLAKGHPATVAEKQAWDRLAEGLEHLPIALEVAAAHLLESKLSARDFTERWLASAKPPAGQVAPSPVEMVEIVLHSLEPTTLAFLRTLSCLDAQPTAIPIALFEHQGDWPLNQAAMEVLERRGLILHDDSGLTVSLHSFIREIVRDRTPTADLNIALGSARSELDALLQRSPTLGGRDAGVREMLIPHCRALLGQLNGHPLELHAGSIARALGDWLKNNGRLAEAETFYRRALAVEERRLGSQHPDLAPRLRDLVALLRAQRRLPEADEVSRRLIDLHEQAPQPDLGVLAGDLTQYAAILRAANRLTDAEKVGRRALELAEEASGFDHPKVALALHHLAGTLEAAHRPREAEPLYRRALAIEERVFGDAHPRLATRLYHLGFLLASMSRRYDADMYLRRGLALEEAKLGPEHPDLAPVLDALGGIMEDEERLPEAEQLYRRALSVLEAGPGPDHPETAMVLTNLAGVLEARGQMEEAHGLYERVAQILFHQTRRLRGPHPHLRSALENLARTLRASGIGEEEVEARLASYRPVVPRRVRSKFLDD